MQAGEEPYDITIRLTHANEDDTRLLVEYIEWLLVNELHPQTHFEITAANVIDIGAGQGRWYSAEDFFPYDASVKEEEHEVNANAAQ